MPLESATYISGLEPGNPPGSDGIAQADDHLRLIKSVLKNSFPNINGAVTATPSVLNGLDGRVTAVENRLDTAESFLLVGEIKLWPGSNIPPKWLPCDGRAVSRTTYAALFAVIGTTFGAGNGSTTFNLPDFRGRMVGGSDPMLGGSAVNRLGSATPNGWTGGSHTVTLSVNHMPRHKHTVWTNGAGAHTHTAWTDIQGAHQHEGTTNSAGSHQHAYIAPQQVPGAYTAGGGGWGAPSDAATSWSGEHTHYFVTSWAGAHQHNVGIGGVGDHTHTADMSEVGDGQAFSVLNPTIHVNFIIYAGV